MIPENAAPLDYRPRIQRGLTGARHTRPVVPRRAQIPEPPDRPPNRRAALRMNRTGPASADPDEALRAARIRSPARPGPPTHASAKPPTRAPPHVENFTDLENRRSTPPPARHARTMQTTLIDRHGPSPRLMTTQELRASGLSKRRIAHEVETGHLIRTRLGRYLPHATPAPIVEAACLGGRLDCLSLLRGMGVFVLQCDVLHLQLDAHATRLPTRPHGVRAHWRRSLADADAAVVGPVEALAQSVACQGSRASIATLDSAWHLGVVDRQGIADVFARLPGRFHFLRGLLDPRSEAGSESLVRLMLRSIGCRFDLQVPIGGVGRVDFVVDGWLIVECDSREFHSSWEMHQKDRRRDAAALERGYATLRLLAADVFSRPEEVSAQLRRIIERGEVPRSGRRRRQRDDLAR